MTIFVQKKLFFLQFCKFFTFFNACAIQTNLGTKEMLRKNCAVERIELYREYREYR